MKISLFVVAFALFFASPFVSAQSVEGDIDETTVTVPELSVAPLGYDKTVTLSWPAPADHAVSFYYVYRTRDGVRALLDKVEADTLEYTVIGDMEGDIYNVRAVSVGPLSDAALPWCDDVIAG